MPLVRQLEPEVMDSAAEASGYDAMDHREVNQRFVADFLAAVARSPESHYMAILDLGTGTAQIPLELCRQHAGARVLAVDAAAHMLTVAAANIARCQQAAGRRRPQIELLLADAKRLPLADGSCSAVISNSIVHHIPEPRQVFAEAVRVLVPGGLLLVRDLLRPDSDAQVRQLVDLYAAGANEHQRQMFDDSLRAALSLAEIRALVRDLGCEEADVLATSDRHWTWCCWS